MGIYKKKESFLLSQKVLQFQIKLCLSFNCPAKAEKYLLQKILQRTRAITSFNTWPLTGQLH